MNYDVIVTCAVTGAGDTRDKNPHVPVTPQEIADSAIAAAKAGANAVKVQTFRPESMTLNLNNDLFKTRTDSAWAGQKLFDLYQKGALPYGWHTPIQKQAHDVGLEFFSSPFDEEAVDFLEIKSAQYIEGFGEEQYQIQLETIQETTTLDLVLMGGLKKFISAMLITPILSILKRKT